jgi:hypothetical protein
MTCDTDFNLRSTKKGAGEGDEGDGMTLHAHGSAGLKEDLGIELSRIASRTSQRMASETHGSDKVCPDRPNHRNSVV